MSQYNHIHDVPDAIVKCSHCDKKYSQSTEDQVPGFRSRDYDRCPYCGESNGARMQVEYSNRKIES
ncbi:hypothetical protein [Planococcus antarcticus]|uniref:hypothetical protein n=1 Tax=Planococcus antarcticus TaxID=161360 RepID=UPI0012DD8ADD|nr:hypothetical protein [Planococcus antarcticus]